MKWLLIGILLQHGYSSNIEIATLRVDKFRTEADCLKKAGELKTKFANFPNDAKCINIGE